MTSSLVFTVTELNRYIKTAFDSDFTLQSVYLSAEISNFTNHVRSGHYYMTLKDENACIRAVMFQQSNRRLKFMPENGMRVIARGRVSVFERDGQYQLYLEDMQPDGVGALQIAFDQLRAKLEKQGLFDQAYKKELPHYPKRIAVVTSPTGAALQDILSILARRWPQARVILCPVQVQGEGAREQIADAILRLNAAKAADVMIVGRGGGSLEELWAFNEEMVARAVAGSEIPVISAVGHETDYTICDFAADLRAPTPSAAAELAVPDRLEELRRLQALRILVKQRLLNTLQGKEQALMLLQNRLTRQHPLALLENRRQMLDSAATRLEQSIHNLLALRQSSFAASCGKLHALSPLKILQRGYAAVYRADQPLIRGQDLHKGDTLRLRFADAAVNCTVEEVQLVQIQHNTEVIPHGMSHV